MIPIITGADGYIGTNLKHIFDKHEKPYAGLDRKSGPDLLSAEGRDLFEECAVTADVVIHLAALPRIPPSWQQPADYIKDNIELTEYVARVCAEQGCHLIYASSSSVYGDGDGPLNPYSWTKKAAEDIIRIYGQTNLKYTICRIFTTYGNNGPLVLDTWLRKGLKGEPITIYGDGSQSRDFIHVSDVAEALYSAYLAKLDEETLDIGTGQSHKLVDLAGLFGTEIQHSGEQMGYAHATQANAQRTKELLNWAPKHNPKNWIRSNLDT